MTGPLPASPWEEFRAELREARREAVDPSYGRLRVISKHELSKATISALLTGKGRIGPPRWDKVVSFLEALRSSVAAAGIDPDMVLGTMDSWRQRYLACQKAHESVVCAASQQGAAPTQQTAVELSVCTSDQPLPARPALTAAANSPLRPANNAPGSFRHVDIACGIPVHGEAGEMRAAIVLLHSEARELLNKISNLEKERSYLNSTMTAQQREIEWLKTELENRKERANRTDSPNGIFSTVTDISAALPPASEMAMLATIAATYNLHIGADNGVRQRVINEASRALNRLLIEGGYDPPEQLSEGLHPISLPTDPPLFSTGSELSPGAELTNRSGAAARSNPTEFLRVTAIEGLG